MNGKHLNFNQRLQIETLYNVGKNQREIAKYIGCSQSTISHELKRGEYMHLNSDFTYSKRYSPQFAEKKYRQHLKNKGPQLKIDRDVELSNFVKAKIGQENLSPRATIKEIERQGVSFKSHISHTTLYRYMEEGIIANTTDNIKSDFQAIWNIIDINDSVVKARCSKCENICSFEENHYYKYCPECGTKMCKKKSEMTWYDIEKNKDKFQIGDEIKCQLNNGAVAYAVVAATNFYDTNQIVFVFKDCIGDKKIMNEKAINDGGWRDCKIRKYINKEIYSLLPKDLKEVIKPRIIEQKEIDEVYTSEDYLWLLSDTEVFGYNNSINIGDSQFPLFLNNSYIKKCMNGKECGYWLRSEDYPECFGFVNADGSYSNQYACFRGGIVVGFLV